MSNRAALSYPQSRMYLAHLKCDKTREGFHVIRLIKLLRAALEIDLKAAKSLSELLRVIPSDEGIKLLFTPNQADRLAQRYLEFVALGCEASVVPYELPPAIVCDNANLCALADLHRAEINAIRCELAPRLNHIYT